MAEYCLCALCAERFQRSRKFAERKSGIGISLAQNGSGCFICQGALSAIPRLAEKALEKSKGFEFSTFSVSSTFPKEVFVKEEALATFFAPGQYSSIKNQANSLLCKAISSHTGKKNDQRDAEASFLFDFALSQAHFSPSPVFVFGHYLKLSRQMCQSKWHCSSCRGAGCGKCGEKGRKYYSVEEELGRVFLEFFEAEGFTLHASGREDVDVRCLGGGRPFVAEISKAKKRRPTLQEIEEAFAGNGNVRAFGLRFATKQMVDLVCNSHFCKEYYAVVAADRPLSHEDAKKAEALSGAVLSQKTPTRVLSRRSDMTRKRKIISISARAEGGKLFLSILAEAGTYIKEFISSDNGRTSPSLSSALNCKAICESLDVTKIHDYFLETVEC